MYDIAVIGLGRVGLPLALSLESVGFSVIGIDINYEEINRSIESKVFPFKEPGYEEMFKSTKIKVYSANDYVLIPEASTYIITVGTPLMQHIEADLSNVRSTVKNLIYNVNMKDKMIILRSTVAPKTTASLKTFIETTTSYKVGENIFLAMCPERLAEGVALEELHKLPQIIGTEDDISKERAEAIFSRFGVDIKHVNYIEAELCKLFCNIYRYINFAMPNYFAYIAHQYGTDVYTIFNAINDKYPRNNGLKNPGLVGGTCVKGNRKININYIDKHGTWKSKVITFKSLYNIFEENIFFTNSTNSDITLYNSKLIKSVIKNKYSGDMYKFHLSNGTKFECTSYHLLPVYEENTKKPFLYQADSIDIKKKLYARANNGEYAELVDILKVTKKFVTDIDVYNIELQSLEKADDLYYIDYECNLFSHNCLRKDFGMINQDFPQTDLILQAYKINEFMPKFHADLAGDEITGKIIGILGYTMKKDTDDTRDSLVPKLIRYIQNYTPEKILINDPNLESATVIHDEKFNNTNFYNFQISTVIGESDIIFVAMNHSEYYKINLNDLKGKLIIDIWNVFGKGTVFTA